MRVNLHTTPILVKVFSFPLHPTKEPSMCSVSVPHRGHMLPSPSRSGSCASRPCLGISVSPSPVGCIFFFFLKSWKRVWASSQICKARARCMSKNMHQFWCPGVISQLNPPGYLLKCQESPDLASRPVHSAFLISPSVFRTSYSRLTASSVGFSHCINSITDRAEGLGFVCQIFLLAVESLSTAQLLDVQDSQRKTVVTTPSPFLEWLLYLPQDQIAASPLLPYYSLGNYSLNQKFFTDDLSLFSYRS